ncbi:MAG: MFS transporter [Proteobacteria bacterium]|nr:MFS transporter [Pseudomonadota bacterium]
MNTQVKHIAIYTITHALVDACCAGLIFSSVSNYELNYAAAAIIIYNLVAFGSQPIFGMITDKFKNPVFMASLGCLVTAIPVFFANNLMAIAIVAGIGNAMFHVGAGVSILRIAKGKSTIPGIFVGPGALGLFIGGFLGKSGIFPHYTVLILLILCASIILYLGKPEEFKTPVFAKKSSYVSIIIFLLLFSIIIRAFIGKGIHIPWKNEFNLILLLTISIMLGKISGGVVADKFGWLKTAVLGLVISAPLLSLGITHPIIFCLGVFCFNLTMPVTLTALANIMHNHHGLAFGLTTLSLVLGAFPIFLGLNFTNQYFIFGVILLSATILYIAINLYLKQNKGEFSK